ncbi:centrosomal protein of 120 kDa-like isoform X2 [Babylonia areolata]|uniref:centrosomal protein of 120 kDa-like isoform X2 n=1 Tax=Babylonia areolata TaxID=304850 RepID=UPI003FD1E835
MGDRFLVVISALEGRGFPKRPRQKILAEARFDGELLATDPVDHVDSPDFTQELAWELDKKALQQHRLQRTSIKIQCFAQDSNSGQKEPIGYVILDVRSAAQNKQVAKWYPLLHCKYTKAKPEIRLALYLDEDKSPPKEGTVKVQEKDKKTGLAVPANVNVKSLVPVLNEQEGFYQLGPAHSCSDQFVLSVTIAYANNLPQLVPSSMPLPAASSGFFFYYSLLGNDVTNETFSDLLSPAFPAERASVRIRSSVDALRAFFSHQPGLQIHLCCGDQSLGSCEVPLKSLLKKDSTEIYMKPVSVEGDFQLVPPNKVKQQMPALPPSVAPLVGVSVVLRKEDMGAVTPVKDHANNAALPVSGAASPVLKTSPSQHSPPQRDKPANAHRDREDRGEQQTKVKHGDGGDGAKGEDYSDSFEDDETHNSASLGEQVKKMAGQRQDSATGQPGTSKPPSHSGAAADSVSTSEMHHAIPPQAHHFTFALDLRSIRDNASPNTISVFLRYTYPFFGSAAPILTHPPVDIRKGSEVLLPQSFCAFDFACTLWQLQDTFRRVPLVVEVWHRDKQLSRDVLLGTARLPLASIITAEKTRTLGANTTMGWRQELADRIPVTAMEGQLQQCAEVSLVMALEDWGPIAPTIVTSDSTSQQQSSQMPVGAQGGNSYPKQELSVSPRQTSEYQAALELEIWKETQQQAFEKELKQKESQYMKALADEWKKRDKEREVLMQKKLTEYTQWEAQLKKTLADLEKRDKQLSANEHEVSRLRAELQREHDRKLQEMKEASRRMKDDCDHQVDLERMKVKEMEEIINRYKGELQESDRKYKALEKEFSSFKEQLNSKPEVRLQAEINLLTLEKAELERKLESASQSKVHYKQQWGRALKEVARLKQREQEMARASLRQQQQELEHMRLRYLAAEEKDVARSDNQQLEEIKNELNKLKQMEADKLKQTSDSNFADSGGHKPLNTDMNSSMDEHISRLVEERDTLLRTGVYTTQDKIIVELDRQIREAIAQRNR